MRLVVLAAVAALLGACLDSKRDGPDEATPPVDEIAPPDGALPPSDGAPPPPADGALPQPASVYLVVRKSGSGTVTSVDAPGIACGDRCEERFTLPVTLTAVADAGWTFREWGGACSGSGTCTVASGARVSATFEMLPPLPSECGGMLPAAVPAPVAIRFEGEPLVDAATDGSGERFLFTTSPGGMWHSRAYRFVHVSDGAATETAVHAIRGDTQGYVFGGDAHAQPEGFAVFRTDGYFRDGAHGFVDLHAGDGTLLATRALTSPLAADSWQFTDHRVAPSGGVAFIRDIWSGSGPSASYVVRYGRLDGAGAVVASDVSLDSHPTAWAIDLAGNVLLLRVVWPAGRYGPQVVSARWLDPAGAPLTGWFSLGDVYVRNPHLVLLRDGLALREPDGRFSHVFPSAQAGTEKPPEWLARRGEQRFALLPDGRGYAVWGRIRQFGSNGPCEDGIEILTNDGQSCGCVAIPRALAGGWIRHVGRDGSVVAEMIESLESRWIEVYPGVVPRD